MLDRLPEEAQQAYLELTAKYFEPDAPLNYHEALNGFWMQQDCHDFGDIGFQGIWSFGPENGIWLSGWYEGWPTEKGLTRFSRNEIYETQHIPFQRQVSGLRTGGLPEYFYESPQGFCIYSDRPVRNYPKKAIVIRGVEMLYLGGSPLTYGSESEIIYQGIYRTRYLKQD